MGCSHIIWNRKARQRFEEIATWYACNMGEKAATKFANGIYDTLMTLSHSPLIGMVDERRSAQKVHYYSFYPILNIASYIVSLEQPCM